MSKKTRRQSSSAPAEAAADHGPGERLQKVLAAAGIGSRRDCEELIREGRVEIDRKVVTELGTRVDPLAHEVRVDGEALRQPKRLYFAVNKPVGVVTTNNDPSGRSRVIDLVPTEERVFAVGRLDRASEGLILVTNDGEFANRLTHPRYGVEKTYLVRVAGAPDQRQLARLKQGVHLAEGFARAQSILVKKQHGQSTDMVIVLNEGRNREIRRILARIGHKVLALKRTAVGNVKLGDLPLGAWRKLLPAEIEGLLHLAKEKRREGKKQSQVQGPKSKVAPRESVSGRDEQYVQKQALLSEPLSLDDLLRDDLDEGPLTGDSTSDMGHDESIEIEPGETSQGGVIDYEDEFSPPLAQPPQPLPQTPKATNRLGKQSPAGRQHAKRPAHPSDRNRGGKGPDKRERNRSRGEQEAQPRETFGKKRGGKKVFGPREEGRGPAGEKAGNFRFKPKGKGKPHGKKSKPKPSAHGADNQRRGDRRGGKQGQQAGRQFGKQGGKQGGKRKGRR
jgi:23S rRNA pseudouridine2605 synthase